MPNRFIFADEAGCFAFSRGKNESKYFILCTVAMTDCLIDDKLLNLRRKLVWDGVEVGDYFHACTDKQRVRDAVFDEIAKERFIVQATIMEKSKAQPQVRISKPTFYKYGYYYHFKYAVGHMLSPTEEPLVTVASLGTNKERRAFENAVDDVMRQTHSSKKWKADFRPCSADPCLQVADYCAWAIQRKWERNDIRSYDLIKRKIAYEFDLWKKGDKHYY